MAFIHQPYLKCFSKGEDDMDASGLTTFMGYIAKLLEEPLFQGLVTKGSISQSELDSTRKNLAGIYAILEKTPRDKIEAMVAKHNEQITEHVNFAGGEQEDPLGAFRQVQIIAGYFTTIMAESGLRG
jgi:hypothetical protein